MKKGLILGIVAILTIVIGMSFYVKKQECFYCLCYWKFTNGGKNKLNITNVFKTDGEQNHGYYNECGCSGSVNQKYKSYDRQEVQDFRRDLVDDARYEGRVIEYVNKNSRSTCQ